MNGAIAHHSVQSDETPLVEKITEIKKSLGKDLCILAHLYQRKTISDLANFKGDSFGLSREAAQMDGGKYIVFCGVRFMAESARILCRNDQEVLHPDPEAGCPMADMAPLNKVSEAFENLSKKAPVTPITYMNSTADVKAFCGKNGGLVCTSSNAHKAFEWAFQNGSKIFFLPDEHLGKNTAAKLGIGSSQVSVWDPENPNPCDIENTKVIVWKGHCPVHMKFTARDIEHVRRFYPGAIVLVHPECPHEVAELADHVGSTEFIRQYVERHTKPGDKIFIGTEMNLVQNLQSHHKDRLISKLHRSLCLTMYQITLEKLLFTLQNIETFEKVEVPEDIKHFARVSLDRMLSLQ